MFVLNSCHLGFVGGGVPNASFLRRVSSASFNDNDSFYDDKVQDLRSRVRSSEGGLGGVAMCEPRAALFPVLFQIAMARVRDL